MLPSHFLTTQRRGFLKGSGLLPDERQVQEIYCNYIIQGQYLFIQKQRYGEKLNYEILEDERLGDYQLPKLVLQPLVENAIYHGIKEIDRPGLIRVTTEVSGDSACVSIFDNGRGIDRSESTDQTLLRLGGVGLKNVDQRLHLQFGEAYHMEIDSKANSYTKITLYLPLSSSDEYV